MKASIFFLVLASASAAPQFEGLKNIFSALSGDDEPGEVNGDYEQVPYTTLKKFDGYEMRQYPSVKWVCTDVTYKMEKEDSVSRDTNDFNLIKMVQEMMSGKGWKEHRISTFTKDKVSYFEKAMLLLAAHGPTSGRSR